MRRSSPDCEGTAFRWHHLESLRDRTQPSRTPRGIRVSEVVPFVRAPGGLEAGEDGRHAEKRAEHDGGDERGGGQRKRAGAGAGALPVERHVRVVRGRGGCEGVVLAGSATSEVGTVGLCVTGSHIESVCNDEGKMENGIHTPMGRELSTNAHVDDVQIHFPAIGSQKGVEQFAGTACNAGQCS